MKTLRILHTLAALVLLAACDVHEFPAEEAPVPPPPPPPPPACELNLTFEGDDFDFLTNVTVGDKERSRSGVDPAYELRYIIRAYRSEPGKGSRAPSRTEIDYTTANVAIDGNYSGISMPLELEPGEYQIVVWADQVPVSTSADYYYTTGDFREIRLAGAGDRDYVHPGNDSHRSAWRGTAMVVVDEDGAVALQTDPATIVERVDVEMTRPMARYHFISNDLGKFLESERRKAAAEAPGLEAPGVPAPPAPDLADYSVVMRYTGYMPCAYNIFTDKPVDSATGVSFEGHIRAIDEKHAELAFDHVFVNHNRTSAQVALELYRRSDGKKLSSTGVIDVPLQRGCYTTVTGPMLTTTAGTSMGINPDFNGDWNIEIH